VADAAPIEGKPGPAGGVVPDSATGPTTVAGATEQVIEEPPVANDDDGSDDDGSDDDGSDDDDADDDEFTKKRK
jgi:hypothetical protein